MIVQFIVNNYVLGSAVRMTPTHKITKKERIDRNHTVIVYSNLTENEYQFILKCFPSYCKPYKGIIKED